MGRKRTKVQDSAHEANITTLVQTLAAHQQFTKLIILCRLKRSRNFKKNHHFLENQLLLL